MMRTVVVTALLLGMGAALPAFAATPLATSLPDAAASPIATVRYRQTHRQPQNGSHVYRFQDGHTGRGFNHGLAGGTFAWPYYDYCTRHPGDQSC
jgi:hypothetical protein